MDRKLKEDTYQALKKYFEKGYDKEKEAGKLYSAIPPMILENVLQLLVAPVAASLLANYLMGIWSPGNSTRAAVEKLEELKKASEEKIGRLLKRIGTEKEKTKELVETVSVTVTVKEYTLKFSSSDEMIEVIEKLLEEQKD